MSDAEKMAAVDDDGDEVAAEQRKKVGDRRVGGNRFEPRHHHLLHRMLECTRRVLQHRAEHVALVNKAHDAFAVDHGQLREIGGAHAHEGGAQRVVGMHHDLFAFGKAAE